VLHDRSAGKWQAGVPDAVSKLAHQHVQAGAAATQQQLVRQVIELVKLSQGQLHAADPDAERFAERTFYGRHFILRYLAAAEADLELFGDRKFNVQVAFDGTGVSPAADAEHLGSLHAAVGDDGDVGGAATHVHQNSVHAGTLVVADDRPGACERLSRYGQQVKSERLCRALERADVYQRRERRVQLHYHVPALETDRAGYLVSVNLDPNKGAVDQPYLDLFAAKLPRQLLLGL